MSPSIEIPNNALTYQIEYDLALRTYAAITNNKLGVDDTLALFVSFNNGATWDKTNMIKVYTSADSAVMSGNHVNSARSFFVERSSNQAWLVLAVYCFKCRQRHFRRQLPSEG